MSSIPSSPAPNGDPNRAAEADVPLIGAEGMFIPLPKNRWAVPSTLYIWLALIVLAVGLPRVMETASAGTKKTRAHAAREAGITSPEFEKYLTAESSAKAAFGMQSLLGGLDNLSGQSKTGGTSGKMLGDAVKDYRALLATNPSPNLARRTLVLEHALHKPLDEELLTGPLQTALSEAKTPARDQAAEFALWRGMYGDAPQSPRFVQDGEKRLRAMRLRFYENRALADLYQSANRKDAALKAETAFRENAIRFATRQFFTNGTIVLLFLLGLVFLVLFAVAASSRNWNLIKRIPPQPKPLTWGALLDCFVFYLMTIYVARPLVSLWAARFLPEPSMQSALVLSAVVYVGTALISTAYLASILKRRTSIRSEADWSAVAFRAPNGVLGNILYGVAGYCATLPFTLALGSLSRLIFRHSTTTSPNPILPLIVGERDVWGRVVIFLLAAVAAPLFEELFFRGVLFSGLRTRFGWVVSGLISGACFALVHPMQDWLPIFGLGFVLATMREMRQSLVPGITAHFCQNASSFVALSVLFSD